VTFISFIIGFKIILSSICHDAPPGVLIVICELCTSYLNYKVTMIFKFSTINELEFNGR
jgi:hypothetical protein